MRVFWRGIHIPKDLWLITPKMSAIEIMGIPNIELRRAVQERVGWARLLQQARLLDEQKVSWGWNRLYSIKNPGDEDIVFMELTNTTPEPDGHHKVYYQRVPPKIRTVRAGLAWACQIDDKNWCFIAES